MSLNVLDKDQLLRQIARLAERINTLEALLEGQPIGTARIADAAITNAKIASLAADKITAGDFIVGIDVGSGGSGYTRIDGVNNRIMVNDGTNDRILIGYQQNGF